MAKVSHRINGLFLPERRSSYAHSSRVDESFQARLASLLLSRHGRLPRAPCPSPDPADTSGDIDSNGLGSISSPAGPYTSNVDSTIAKLAELGSSELGLIASGFDGPASQYENPNLSYRRRSSQPEVEEGTSTRKIEVSANDSNSNQFMDGNHLEGGLHVPGSMAAQPAPSRQISISPRLSSGPHLPLYTRKPIPPARLGGIEKTPKAEKLHIPGSYRSDTETSTLQSLQLPSPSDRDGSLAEDFISESAQANSKPNAEFHSVARDVAGATPHLNLGRRKEPSQEPVMSSASIQQAHPPLTKPAPGQWVVGRIVEPILTPRKGHSQVCGENQEMFSLLKQLPGLESSQLVDTPRNMSSVDDEAASTINHPASTRSSCSKLSGKLDSPLPAAKHPMKESEDDSLITEQAKTPQPLHFSNTLLHRRKSVAPFVISKTSSADINSFISSDFSNPDSVMKTNAEPVGGKPQGTLQDQPSMRDSSTGQEKDNLRSDILPLSNSHSLPSNEKADKALDTTNTESHVGILKTPDEEQPEPKMHWIRQLLASASTSSLSPNQQSTGAGLSHRQSYATNGTAFQQGDSAGFNEGSKPPSHVPTAGMSYEKPQEIRVQRSTEPFTRAFHDLEALLREALLVAKQAAEPARSPIELPPTEYPISHENCRSQGGSSVNSSYGSNDSHESSSSTSEGDEEEHYTTIPAVFKGSSRFRGEPGLTTDTAPRSRRSLAQALDQPLLILPKPENIGTEKHSFQVNTVKSHHRLPQEIDGTGDDEPEATRGFVNHTPGLAPLAGADNRANSFDARDWALVSQPSQTRNLQPPKGEKSSSQLKPTTILSSVTEQHDGRVSENRRSSTLTSEPSMRLGTDSNRRPQIQPRTSSARLRPQKAVEPPLPVPWSLNENSGRGERTTDPRSSGTQRGQRPQPGPAGKPERGYSFAPSVDPSPEGKVLLSRQLGNSAEERVLQGQDSPRKAYSLNGRRHVSLRGASGFSLTRSHRRAPLARDWSPSRKRYVATVTCINTALMGLIIGIYAGEVPAIQYAIVDENHYTILGNVVFFLGLAITTFLAWPLPLLHGRKPYTLAAFALILPLQFPQALAVGRTRSPYVATYRVALLLPRAIAGVVMGFANINFKTTLLDLFGASLQSANPHQEVVSSHDVRRHGGGMGVWLGIWTWCSIGSIGIGFLIGAVVIGELDVAWGFWLSIILIASALVLNVLVPEVRRSAYRRSMAEVRRGSDISRRVARGEIKMHLDSTGPMWWGEEVMAGHRLSLLMLKQPGFAVLALYIGWIYGQIIMLIVVSRRTTLV